MFRSVCQTISNEDIYINMNNPSYLTNKPGKSLTLTYESVNIDEKIAQGGYGTVYKARSFNKQFALKKMCVNNTDKLLVCIQEIYILKNVHSDYILHFIDSIIYQTDSDIFEVYILTDFYEGDLSTEMKALLANNRFFDEIDVLMILTNIVEAVACLHNFLSTPIIHRDLKVENILIKYPTRYVLCDFGSATLREVRPCEVNRQELQEEISQYTTLAYRSPEMADLYFDGGEHIVGRKSDIWAIGVLMYNICFLVLPFGDSILSILSGQFTIPDDHNYSDDLMKILNYCLTIDPVQRPDIYQLSCLLFSISSKPNPIKNFEKSEDPNLSTLTLPMTECEAKSLTTNRKQKNTNKNISSQPVLTSIKPRERPKVGGKTNSNVLVKGNQTESINKNKISQKNDLLIFDSNSSQKTTDNKHTAPVKKTKSIDDFDNLKISDSQPTDLMDFNDPINRKIQQLANTSKSQSLGAHFSTLQSGQRYNVYEMISHSYQNVSHFPQFPFNNQGSSVTPNFHPVPIQSTNPFHINNSTSYPVSNPQIYTNTAQIGHRRLISDPSSWYQSSTNSNQSHSEASTTILQPKRIPIKQTVTNVIDEFDPLTK